MDIGPSSLLTGNRVLQRARMEGEPKMVALAGSSPKLSRGSSQPCVSFSDAFPSSRSISGLSSTLKQQLTPAQKSPKVDLRQVQNWRPRSDSRSRSSSTEIFLTPRAQIYVAEIASRRSSILTRTFSFLTNFICL